jgi:hypothetical protein
VLIDELFFVGDSLRYENPVTGYPYLGATPWENPQRYIDASPLFAVKRLRAPVMLMQSDLDTFFSMEQADELFTALFRLRKEAQYVRYWGEWHTPKSPANIRDLWSRTLAWYDQWCDISRDAQGRILYTNGAVRSRNGAPAWTADRFLNLDWFFKTSNPP